jgi:hypothetical protein
MQRTSLNAEINASSEHGKVSGEIVPGITRMLPDELTFILPFTLKDELTLLYADTFRKLKTYRKYPLTEQSSAPVEEKVSQAKKIKKGFSFWSL